MHGVSKKHFIQSNRKKPLRISYQVSQVVHRLRVDLLSPVRQSEVVQLLDVERVEDVIDMLHAVEKGKRRSTLIIF